MELSKRLLPGRGNANGGGKAGGGGLLPASLFPARSAGVSDRPARPWFASDNMRPQERQDLYRALAGYIRSGVPLRDVLAKTRDKVGEVAPRDVQVRLCHDVLEKIGGSRPLSVALSAWVPTQEQMVIRAGERQGSNEALAAGLDQAAEIAGTMSTIASTIKAKLTYPAILMVGVSIVIYVFCFEIVPELYENTPPEAWTGVSAALLGLSNFLHVFWPLVLAAVAGAGLWVVWSLSRVVGPIRDSLDNVLPWSVYRSVVGASFLHAVGAMVRGGSAFDGAIKEMQTISTAYQGAWIQEIRRRLQSGSGPIGALDCRLFDVKTRIALHVSGDVIPFADLLIDLANRQLDGSLRRLNVATSIVMALALAIALIVVVVGYFTVWNITGQSGDAGGMAP